MPLTHPLDVELGHLWRTRHSLDEKGWVRLYNVVREVLISFRPKELAGLRDDRNTYVQDFFDDKVFKLDSLSTCQHVGALKVYYVRYLRDRLDIENRWIVSETVDADAAEAEDSAAELSNPTYDTVRGCSSSESAWESLREAGLSVDDVAMSAAGWLKKSEPWVAPYLALNFCPDAELCEPLSTLAKRLRVKSYHHKAVKLGISWAGGNDKRSFGDTFIGKWIVRDLHLPLSVENSHLIEAAFKILCFEALSWAEQQEYAP